MRFTRITAALLALLTALSVLTGCNDTAGTSAPPTADIASPTDVTTDNPPGDGTFSVEQYDAAYASLPPDTVIMTVDGSPILWEEFFYFLAGTIRSFEAQMGPITDWSAEYPTGGTYGESILSAVRSNVISYHSIWFGARQLGVTLSESALAEVDQYLQFAIDSSGGEEAFNEYLRSLYFTYDAYKLMLEALNLRSSCFTLLYGENGENIADEDVEAQIEPYGFLMAKHILIKTFKDDPSQPYSDEEKAEAHSKAETILKELQAYTGDDLEAFFTEKMLEYSEDTGVSAFPNGYLFQEGEMVEGFTIATQTLLPGRMSGLVETEYGYHIILRLPIDYDAIPDSEAGQDSAATLRQSASQMMFNILLTSWQEEVPAEDSAAFASIDLAKLFA